MFLVTFWHALFILAVSLVIAGVFFFAGVGLELFIDWWNRRHV